jgi:hypothetical protein
MILFAPFSTWITVEPSFKVGIGMPSLPLLPTEAAVPGTDARGASPALTSASHIMTSRAAAVPLRLFRVRTIRPSGLHVDCLARTEQVLTVSRRVVKINASMCRRSDRPPPWVITHDLQSPQ